MILNKLDKYTMEKLGLSGCWNSDEPKCYQITPPLSVIQHRSWIRSNESVSAILTGGCVQFLTREQCFKVCGGGSESVFLAGQLPIDFPGTTLRITDSDLLDFLQMSRYVDTSRSLWWMVPVLYIPFEPEPHLHFFSLCLAASFQVYPLPNQPVFPVFKISQSVTKNTPAPTETERRLEREGCEVFISSPGTHTQRKQVAVEAFSAVFVPAKGGILGR